MTKKKTASHELMTTQSSHPVSRDVEMVPLLAAKLFFNAHIYISYICEEKTPQKLIRLRVFMWRNEVGE